MSRFANDVLQYIHGLEVGFEKSMEFIRAVDYNVDNVKHLKMMVRSILTTVSPSLIDEMSMKMRNWIKDLQETDLNP